MGRFNTDKYADRGGGLIEAYEKMFAPIKDSKIKYLELGIKDGGSLEWAKDYFKNNVGIYGIDISEPISIPGTVIFKADQNDTPALEKIGAENGPFDVIIDDASHLEVETRNTFNCLFKCLNPGGYYVIEDWLYSDRILAQWLVARVPRMELLVKELLVGRKGAVVNGDHLSYAVYRKE